MIIETSITLAHQDLFQLSFFSFLTKAILDGKFQEIRSNIDYITAHTQRITDRVQPLFIGSGPFGRGKPGCFSAEGNPTHEALQLFNT